MPSYQDREGRRGGSRRDGDGNRPKQQEKSRPRGEGTYAAPEKPFFHKEREHKPDEKPARRFGPAQQRPGAPQQRSAPGPQRSSQAQPRPARPPRAVSPASPPERVRPPFDGEEPLPRENLLAGRNPIREAIKSGRDIERMLVVRGELSGSAREIVAMARERHIVVQVVDRSRLDEITPNHQGMIAFASAFRYSEVEDMLSLAKERGEEPLLVILDGVTDPHNLGAIIRSAECAGAHGVIVPERRAVGLTPAAVKASAGAVEYLPVARVGNLTRMLETLKEQGLWIVAADMGGEAYTGVDLTGPLAVIIGAEGEGVSRLLLERSDRRVALPMRGKIASLNASVAAGVLLYEVRRQRG